MQKRLLRNIMIEECMDDVAPQDPTFRRSVKTRHMALHVSSRNICEISTQLAQAFWRYTDWGCWAVMTGEPSWLCERHLWKLDYGDAEGREQRMLEELVRQVDVVHLDSLHLWSFLKTQRNALMGRKRMVVHHHGGRLRGHPEIAETEMAAGYSVLVSTPDLLMTAPQATWLPSPVPIEEIDANYQRWEHDPSEFVVGHGYTIAENKGTYDLARIMSQFRHAPQVRLLPWTGIRRRQSLWLMSQCDAYFASFLYGPGVGAYEAMAMGIPVLCGCSEEELYWQCHAIGVEQPEDLPWIYVRPDTLPDWVRLLANDLELRQAWGAKGRAYVEEYHHVERVVARLKAVYEATEPCREVLWDV